MNKQEIIDWFEKTNENKHVFLVDVSIMNNKIFLTLDHDDKISLEECAFINRQLRQYLDDTLGEDHPYSMEVSSPGLGKPLKIKRQFRKNVGRNLKVTMSTEGCFEGKLKKVEEDKIFLEIPKLLKQSEDLSLKSFVFEEIKEAKVLINF